MDLTTCKLYGVQRKRDLSNILKTNCKEINKIVNSYKPYIANKSKKRLIEPVSSVELKKVQKKIQNLLKEIEYDSNVFSGISGRSYGLNRSGLRCSTGRPWLSHSGYPICSIPLFPRRCFADSAVLRQPATSLI